MTDRTDPIIGAINDARALLDSLLAEGWSELHVASGETAIFIARQGAQANPLRAPVDAAPPPTPSSVPAVGADCAIRAPHVATLAWLAPAGTKVAAGDRVALLDLLGEEIALAAPVAGEVIHGDVALPSLVEYDDSVVFVREAA